MNEKPKLGDTLLFARPQFITYATYGRLSGWKKYHQCFGAAQSCSEIVRGGAAPAIDRTGTLEHPLRYANLDPIPDIVGFNKTFEEVCMERAQEILSKDGLIDVYWSGGIDSTCALVSLLMCTEDHDRITVRFEKDALDEYPWFFENCIKNKLNYEILNDFVYRSYRLKDNITVTGEMGDQIFGSISAGKIFDDMDSDWSIIFDSDLHFEDPKVREEIVDGMRLQTAAAPLPIKSVFDFYWWVVFSLKWQIAYYRCFAWLPLEGANMSNLQPFFYSDDFQRWSIVNHDLKIKDTWESFKFVSKDVIYKYTKDPVYRDTKLKEASLNIKGRPYKLFPTDFCAIDSEYNHFVMETLEEDFTRKDFSKFINPKFDFTNLRTKIEELRNDKNY